MKRATISRTDWSLAAALLAMAAVLLFASFSTRAQVPAGLPMLLAAPAADAVRALEKGRPAERGVARQRPVAVAFEYLDPPSGPVPARLGVELFDGVVVVVDFVRIDRRRPGNYTWHGRVEGYDRSEAVLTVVDGAIAGTIALVDSGARIAATYQLQTNRDGTQSLRQVDQGGFPTDHPPGSEQRRAPAPEKTGPHGGRGAIDAKAGDLAADSGATIDVLIVYSKQTATAAGTAIAAQAQQAIDSANAAYANSGIATRLHLVHVAAVNYDESGSFDTDLSRLTAEGDGYLDEVATLRNTHGADLVSLFIENGQYCGIAWIGPHASYAFSVINRGCASGNLSFAHELGHNFGALHDPYVDPGNSPYAYGHGYALPAARWRTVMAYNNVCSAAGTSCTRIPYFSNPNLTYGSPAQALGTAATSDNARVHNQNASTIANFRTAGTSTCTFAFSPASASVAATATSGSTSVTAGTGCAWNTTSSAGWLTVGAGSATSGSGPLNYTAAANSGPARSGTITVGGVGFTVSQANGCTYTLSANSASFPASGGSGSVNLATGAGCPWTVSSSAAWLTVSSAKSGSGSTTVNFTAAANTSTSTLSANLTVGSASFIVTQTSTTPPLTTAAASFVGTDLVTRGNWKAGYGRDGYGIVGDSSNYPAYATVTATGKQDHVWAVQPDGDARALQRGAVTGRIAACWYSASSFDVDVNLTDQGSHRVAVYLLDWDDIGRVARVDVLDATTQQVLDTRTVSSYQQGVYLTWNLTGHVVLRFTTTGGANAVLSGIFFGAAALPTTFSVSGSITSGGVGLSGAALAAGGASCTATDATGRYTCTAPQGWSGTITPSLNGYNFAPSSRSYSNVTADQTGQDYTATVVPPAVTSTVLSSSSNPASAGTSVTFTATVTAAGATPTGSVSFTAGGAALSGCSARALNAVGIANCSTSSLGVGTHSILASYGGSTAHAASVSATLSQVISASAPSAVASFVGTDLVTRGNWKDGYGRDGYGIVGDSSNYPAYATVTATGKHDHVWAVQPDSDARALQRGAVTGRIAACWYSASSFDVDVNLTDQGSHRVAVYLLDWDDIGRVTRVDVLDAITQQVLDTRTVSSYQQGVYLTWNLTGHVVLRFTTAGGANAVLSGIFFGAAALPTTLSVSGSITSGGVGLSGAALAAGGASCTATDATGRYACTVPQGWSGSIAPSLSGYNFAPSSRSYSNVTADQIGQDYTATVVPPAVTSTALSSSSNPALSGTSVTFTATVTAAGATPTGSVSFTAGGAALSGCSARALNAVGIANCSTSSLGVGSHSIVASYGGSTAHAASVSATLSQVISASAPSAAASFVGTDLETRGNWKDGYGRDGYGIVGDSSNYPAYATVTATGKQDYVWAVQPDSDARALQRDAATGRIAACWYSAGSFEVDINLTDQGSHRVAVYLLDWDDGNRATRVDVLDVARQQVLDTRTVLSYQQGVYLTWNLTGHVVLRFTTTGGSNTVLSGIFFE